MGKRDTGLVDSAGRPIQRDILEKEIAGPTVTGVRQVLGMHPEEGLTPQRLAAMLKAAEAGDANAYLELAEAMEEKDLQYRATLMTRKLAVSQLDITVEPASKDAADVAAADLVRGWIERDTLEDELFDIMDGLGKGYSVSELIWRQTADRWLPERLEWRDPRWFEIDRLDGRTVYLRGESGMPEPLAPFKFLVHTPKTKSGMTIRGGLARAVAWIYLFKNYSVKDWVAFAEIYGLPFRVGKYEDGASEENIRKLARAISQIGSDAAAVIAKSMDIEFVDGKRGGGVGAGGAEVFSELVKFCDEQISKAVLGQTATTDATAGGLGGSQGDVHDRVRGDIKRADAKQLAAALNRDIVRPIVDLNLGPPKSGRYPTIKIALPNSVDMAALATALAQLVPLGLKVGTQEVLEKLGLQVPEAGAEVLQATQPTSGLDPAAAPGGPGSPADGPGGRLKALTDPTKRLAASLTAGAGAPDAIDHLIDDGLNDWEALLDPVVSGIEEVLESCTTLEEARDRLSEALGAMEVEVVQALLARSGFAARLAGASGQLVSQVEDA